MAKPFPEKFVALEEDSNSTILKAMDRSAKYPDISAILARKEEGRKQRAKLSFAEKLAALDALKARVEPLVRARELRRTQRRSGKA
jgi:hypothetical protein